MEKDFSLKNAKKQKDFLLCIDSDGCAFDTMNAKHKLCFAPLALEFFNITKDADELYASWQKENLYTATRGINRFKGIAHFLERALERGALDFSEIEIEMLKKYCNWTIESKALSNGALENYLSENENSVAKTVLAWSKAVNEKIESLTYEEKRLFNFVKETLNVASEKADIAVVSSAPAKEIYAEWEHAGLLEFVSTICTQEDGSKATVIKVFLERGYNPENVLMVGDAIADLENAHKCNALFFPVIPDSEEESWALLKNTYLKSFLEKNYKELHEAVLIESLNKKLPKQLKI